LDRSFAVIQQSKLVAVSQIRVLIFDLQTYTGSSGKCC
jgi:hypothetical protein